MTTTREETVSAWLTQAAEGQREAPAIGGVDDTEFLSHGGLLELIDETGRALRGWGIGRGDIVLVALPDGPVALTVLLAVSSVATPLPVPAHEQPEEYARVLDALPIRAVVMEERPDAALTRLVRDRGLTLLEAVRRPDAGAGSFDLRCSAAREPRTADPPTAADDALLCLTSGTSSVPKVVAITHESLWTGVRAYRDWTEMSAADVSLCMMPIAHLHSLFRSSLPVLAAGGAVVWTPGFSRRDVLGWLDRFRPTYISAAPAIHRRLLAAADESGRWPASTGLRLVSVGSDRVEPALMQQLAARYETRVVQFYALSEASPFIAATPASEPRGPDDAAGRVHPAWQVDIVDADGAPLPPGAIGEIALRGGFVNRVVGSDGGRRQQIDAAGRLRTGDRGRVDAEGFLFLEGRTDDVISRGGEKVHPAAVEAALLSHPQVTAAVAFAVPDPVLGARVAAVVECGATPGPTVDEILEWAGRGLKSFMVPERLFVVEQIPTSRVGKVSRRELAARFATATATATAPQAARDAAGASDCESVVEIFKTALRLDAVAADASFFDLGGDSIAALDVLLALEQRFGVSVSPATFMRASSAAALVAHIGDSLRPRLPVELADIQVGDDGPPLVVTHDIDGSTYFAGSLAQAVGSDLPLASFHASRMEIAHAPHADLPTLAADYVTLLRERWPGPYALAGYSLGAHFALAIARHLAAAGLAVPFLAVIDDRADLDRRGFDTANAPARPTVRGFYYRALAASPAAFHAGSIVVFRTEEQDAWWRSDPTGGWGEVALGDVRAITVPGNHHSLVTQAGLAPLGPLLVAEMRAALARPAVAALPVPDEQRSLRLEARRACRQGDLETEIRTYRAAIALDREQPAWVFGNLAEALFQAGDDRAAAAAVAEAVRRDPWPLTTDLRFIKPLVDRGLDDLVAAAIARSRAVEPDHPSVFDQLGRFANRSGRQAEAEVLFRRGLALAPAHLDLHTSLASLLEDMGRIPEALEVLAEAHEQVPGIDWIMVWLSRLHVEAGDADSALELLDSRPGLTDRIAGTNLVRGRALERIGRYEEAQLAFRQAEALAPRPGNQDADAGRQLLRID
jgi:acyl-CoA synthetase (AMP-forming)/AMP-acid ligase II/thioesterase domain-containing protein/acyl carrier protein